LLSWILAAAGPLDPQESRLEERAILAARQIPVSKLEPGLPNQTFDRWFTQTVGPEASINWELNDCGEFTGNPQVDRGRDLPICVAAIASLADGRLVTVEITVGTQRTGIARRFILRYVSIEEDKRFDNIRKLSEVGKRIKGVN
jgi:hypothetical protein